MRIANKSSVHRAHTASEPGVHRARTTGELDAHRVRTIGESDAHHGRAEHAPCAHREGTWAMEWCKGIFWEFKLFCIYLNIPLCLLRHIDVSSRNFENGLYCSLRGGRCLKGDEHQGRALTAPRGQPDTALGMPRTRIAFEHAHMGSTTCVACTPWLRQHGAWCGLPLPSAGTRAPKPCASEPAEKTMDAMSWPDGALDKQLVHTMTPMHSIGAQCPVHQEGTVMGAMPWLVEAEPDEWEQQAQAMGTLTWLGLTHQCGGGTLMQPGQLVVHAAWFQEP